MVVRKYRQRSDTLPYGKFKRSRGNDEVFPQDCSRKWNSERVGWLSAFLVHLQRFSWWFHRPPYTLRLKSSYESWFILTGESHRICHGGQSVIVTFSTEAELFSSVTIGLSSDVMIPIATLNCKCTFSATTSKFQATVLLIGLSGQSKNPVTEILAMSACQIIMTPQFGSFDSYWNPLR